jgi:hypothetical protein
MVTLCSRCGGAAVMSRALPPAPPHVPIFTNELLGELCNTNTHREGEIN